MRRNEIFKNRLIMCNLLLINLLINFLLIIYDLIQMFYSEIMIFIINILFRFIWLISTISEF